MRCLSEEGGRGRNRKNGQHGRGGWTESGEGVGGGGRGGVVCRERDREQGGKGKPLFYLV